MNPNFRADLHIHSNCSDGTDTPVEILHLAKAKGLSGLSITDHDTILAYTTELYRESEELGIKLLRGVEISSEWKGQTVHILGYSFDDRLRSFLKQAIERRNARNSQILENLQKRGMTIEEEELRFANDAQIVGRTHIALAMVQKRFVSSRQEAFDLYLQDGASCYAEGETSLPQEVIQAIHDANGWAILAHPHMYRNDALFQQLFTFPFDGMEAFYAGSYGNVRFVDKARDNGWILTGGSDYHGAIRPFNSIGSSWVNELVFNNVMKPNEK